MDFLDLGDGRKDFHQSAFFAFAAGVNINERHLAFTETLWIETHFISIDDPHLLQLTDPF